VSGKKFSVSKLTVKFHNDMQYCRQLIKDRNMSNVNLIYDSNIKFVFLIITSCGFWKRCVGNIYFSLSILNMGRTDQQVDLEW